MIHHMVGAEALHPVTRLVSRCRRDHDKVGELPGKLDGHGTDPARATNDKERVARAGYWLRTSSRSKSVSQAVIAVSGQLLPRVRKRARLGTDEPFVDQVKLSVGSLTIDGAGVEDRVAGVEQRGLPVRRPRRSLRHPNRERGAPVLGVERSRILASTGLTEIAKTRTSKSRPLGKGRGSSMSIETLFRGATNADSRQPSPNAPSHAACDCNRAELTLPTTWAIRTK